MSISQDTPLPSAPARAEPISAPSEPLATPAFTGAPLLPMPSAQPVALAPNVKLLAPLSRRGHGPGLVLVVPPSPPSSSSASFAEEAQAKPLDPLPLVKWAEEGYTVLQVTVGGPEEGEWAIEKVLEEGVKLCEMDECTGSEVGVIVYEPAALELVIKAIPFQPLIKCLVAWGSVDTACSVPVLEHSLGATTSEAAASATLATQQTFRYPSAHSAYFPLPDRPETYDPASAALAHTRSLEFLKNRDMLDGPRFDLDEHTWYEFEERSLEKTMATMVAEPYVNNIPTLTGGIGRVALTEFYNKHFIHQNPRDTRLHLVSRVKGIDRVVDEFVATMTHDQTIDWLLPGIPATGKQLSIPTVAIVCFRGDRLYHEHIHWDQATVLKQLDLLPARSSFGAAPDKGSFRLPVAGTETSAKLRDEQGARSNEMLEREWQEGP
ncbi:hypothetical protein JCM10207_003733 [Rhodosporidiobolus poonsookiae]